MKKLLAITLFLVSSIVLAADCPQFYPFLQPQVYVKDVVYHLCRSEYAVMYSTTKKTSYWSATVITKEKSLAKLPRKNSFIADPDLPMDHRAYPSDYEGTGYDKGHLTAFKDVGGNPIAAKETFFMSNMIPQSPGNNQNGWRLLEEYVRELSMSVGDLYVMTGPVYLSVPLETIGKSKVAVPDAIYKIVVSKEKKFILAILVPNVPITKKDLNKYITELRTIEDATGIKFFPAAPSNYELKTKI